MKKLLPFILLLLLWSINNYSQDTLKFISGEMISVNTLEVSKEQIKYKKYNNPDGPIFIAEKSEIEYIRYKTGDIDRFRTPKKTVDPSLSKNDLLLKVTKRNNKVYIVSNDENSIIHATNLLNEWGYWIVTKNKDEADFIIRFNVNMALTDGYCSINILDLNDRELFATKKRNNFSSWDFNAKRGAIEVCLKKDVKPLFK